MDASPGPPQAHSAGDLDLSTGEGAPPSLRKPPPVDDGLPHFTHSQVLRVITGIVLCILLAAIDQTVVTPAVPAIASDLNAFGHLSWLVSAYLLTSTAMTPVYGKLSDIYGRRMLLAFAIILFIIASVLCALAQNLIQLILFRALQGIGGAGLMAMSQAAIADVVAPRERGRYQGYMAGTWAIACIAGPILGGYVTDHLTWRWIFWMNVPIGAAALFLSDRGLRILRFQRRETRIDYLGAALLTGFITATLLVMSWGGIEYPWASTEIVTLATLAVVLLALLAWQERRAFDPLLPPRLFANSVFTYGVTIAFMATSGMFAATFILPLLFQLVRGLDASSAGAMLVPFLVSNTIGAFSAGQLARKLGKAKAIVLVGLAGCVVGFVMLALVTNVQSIFPLLLSMFVVGVSIGVCMPSCLVIVQNAAERRDVGAATGGLLFLRSMGGAFGSTLAGAVYAVRFSQRLTDLGVTQHVDIGSLRNAESGQSGLDAATQMLAKTALASGFELVFWICAGLSMIAFFACVLMRDLPLQSSDPEHAGIGH